MARSTEPTNDDDRLDSLSYRDATLELEAILAELEGDDVDIDQLSRQVQRAAALIRLCQERITGARLEVEHVVADLADLGAAPGPGAGSSPGADGLDATAVDTDDDTDDDIDPDDDDDDDERRVDDLDADGG